MFVFGGYIDMRGASDELWQYELGNCHSKNDVGQRGVYFKHRGTTNSANVAHETLPKLPMFLGHSVDF